MKIRNQDDWGWDWVGDGSVYDDSELHAQWMWGRKWEEGKSLAGRKWTRKELIVNCVRFQGSNLTAAWQQQRSCRRRLNYEVITNSWQCKLVLPPAMCLQKTHLGFQTPKICRFSCSWSSFVPRLTCLRFFTVALFIVENGIAKWDLVCVLLHYFSRARSATMITLKKHQFIPNLYFAVLSSYLYRHILSRQK